MYRRAVKPHHPWGWSTVGRHHHLSCGCSKRILPTILWYSYDTWPRRITTFGYRFEDMLSEIETFAHRKLLSLMKTGNEQEFTKTKGVGCKRAKMIVDIEIGAQQNWWLNGRNNVLSSSFFHFLLSMHFTLTILPNYGIILSIIFLLVHYTLKSLSNCFLSVFQSRMFW